MKTALVLLFLLLHYNVLFCQVPNNHEELGLSSPRHAFGDVEIALSPNLLMSTPYESQLAGGLKLRMYVLERFSFDADLMIGKNYLHSGPGIIGLPLFFFGMERFLDSEDGISFGSEEDENSFSSLLFLGAVILLSAEHFAYHIPVVQSADITPYVSLLRLKNLSGLDEHESVNGTESPVGFALGIEFNRYLKRYVLSPYIEYDTSYSGKFKGLNFGFYLGLYFPYD